MVTKSTTIAEMGQLDLEEIDEARCRHWCHPYAKKKSTGELARYPKALIEVLAKSLIRVDAANRVGPLLAAAAYSRR